MTRSSFKRNTYTSHVILKSVHTNLCGPIGKKRYCSDKYFILFVDDYSRMMNVIFLKEKYNAFQMFKWYLDRVQSQIYIGGEFISEEFNTFYNDRGIDRHMSILRTPP